MTYIYLDESGDLSLDLPKRGVSRYFIVTFLLVDKPKILEKIVKKIAKGLGKKDKKSFNMLHARNESKLTRQRLLREISRRDISIFAISIDKAKVPEDIRKARKQLHKLATITLMERVIDEDLLPTDCVIKLIASTWGAAGSIHEEFKSQLRQRILDRHRVDLQVSIKPAHSEKCLQVADMISWAIFRRLEHNDSEYYSLIEQKVLYQTQLP